MNYFSVAYNPQEGRLVFKSSTRPEHTNKPFDSTSAELLSVALTLYKDKAIVKTFFGENL